MGVLADSGKLIFACAGIFLSFSYFAVLQEDVYKKEYGGEKFAFTFFALLVERGINAAIALAGIAVFGGSGVKIPYMEIFNSGISQMLAMAASNEALRFVSYPTQVRSAAPSGREARGGRRRRLLPALLAHCADGWLALLAGSHCLLSSRTAALYSLEIRTVFGHTTGTPETDETPTQLPSRETT